MNSVENQIMEQIPDTKQEKSDNAMQAVVPEQEKSPKNKKEYNLDKSKEDKKSPTSSEQGRSHRKLVIIILIILVVLLAAGAALWFFVFRNKKEDKKMAAPDFDISFDGMVSATGTTTTGMLTEELDLSFLETGLLVEEVYLHSQDTVEAGTRVLKVSEDSLQKALLELEREASLADYEYREEALSAAESKIDAKSAYDKAAAQKSYAKQTYDDTLREASATVTDLEEQIADLQEEIDEYTKATSENYYYTYYDVEGKRKQYSKNAEYLSQLYEEWDIANISTTTTVTTTSSSASGKSGTGSSSASTGGSGSAQGGSGSMPQGSGSGSGGSGSMPQGSGDDSASTAGGSSAMSGSGSAGTTSTTKVMTNDKLTAYQLFEAEVEEEKEEYEQALENYQEKTRLAPYNLLSAQTKMEELQAELTQAQVDYETTKLQAKLTYDQTVAECDQAADTYDNEIERINEELSLAENDCSEANENLEYFKEKLGDGYFYTSSAGNVMMIMTRADETLSGETFVMAYTDADSLSVEVSVDQADIAKLEIGESATVSISGYDTFNGRIAAINPITQSSSRSSVYYTVVVELEGDVSSLSQNLTATVIFGDSSDKDMQSEETKG